MSGVSGGVTGDVNTMALAVAWKSARTLLSRVGGKNDSDGTMIVLRRVSQSSRRCDRFQGPGGVGVGVLRDRQRGRAALVVVDTIKQKRRFGSKKERSLASSATYHYPAHPAQTRPRKKRDQPL